MNATGSQILIECLLEQGVDTVFGYPGGTILNIYDELYRFQKQIRHILTSHEQGAAHAADGYARSTGKTGVCFATSGPGATNLITGIATAYMDSSPVVFITCNVGSNLIGKDSFQEVDITGITMPITKCNYQVWDVDTLADTVREAFAIARSGRPGPVLIDIVKNVTAESAEYTPLPREMHAQSGSLAALVRRAEKDFATPDPDPQALDILVGMIARSQKPLLLCGGGVVRGRAQEEFEKFALKLDAPVAVTLMGNGGFSRRNPLATGMIGMHGSQASNLACAGCDLLIAVGCRFSDRVALDPESFSAQAEIVQIDIDRAEIDKNVKSDLSILGDARRVLALLNEKMKPCSHTEWKDHVFSLPMETDYETDGETLTPKQIMDTISNLAPRDSIIATDVGQHQMWAIQHFQFEYPGQLVTSGGFGTMGFGLGAAIGSKLGNPNKTVLHITGDGCFRMNCIELATEQYYDIPVITLIFNNHSLGMVRQWQTIMYEKRYSETTLDRGPDFVRLAESYGLKGRRVTNVDELEEALREALTCGQGYVIDCSIRMDELVRPMVKGGCPITQFVVQ